MFRKLCLPTYNVCMYIRTCTIIVTDQVANVVEV